MQVVRQMVIQIPVIRGGVPAGAEACGAVSGEDSLVRRTAPFAQFRSDEFAQQVVQDNASVPSGHSSSDACSRRALHCAIF